MSEPRRYPKRLIEVDLPIKRISAHARREKSIRHGHISTLHIWWARRPLAACRAVICAALWPDPGDELCPEPFRAEARRLMTEWATTHLDRCSQDSFGRFAAIAKNTAALGNNETLRTALLDFIADFANWDNSTVPEYLETSRALTQAAHEALGGAPGTRPLVVDPFAGGGSIPLEALRVGADAFASDLNPIPVLLNKVVLEYIPKYGQRLADEVRKWGAWIKEQAEEELAEFYPKDPDGATPIAYLWARTIQCEGPGCGAEVPLIRSLWLAKKAHRSVALQLVPNSRAKRVDFRIIVKDGGRWVDQDDPRHVVENPAFDGTVKRGSATCPCCRYTTPVTRVREQLKERRGGADDARLMAVVTTKPGQVGRAYRLAARRDAKAVQAAADELEKRKAAHVGALPLVPEEPTPKGGGSGAGRAFSQRNYGMTRWCDLFTARQLLALTTFARLANCKDACLMSANPVAPPEESPVNTGLSLAVARLADRSSALCTWRPQPDQEKVEHGFTRQVIPITWDFAEGAPLTDGTAGWTDAVEPITRALTSASLWSATGGTATGASAAMLPLPDDAAAAFVTDPPYYDAVPYSDLSDFFHVWLRRSLPGYSSDTLTPKADECIVDEVKGKDRAYFERTMRQAMAEGRRVLHPGGIGVVVFAHKSTSGWEAQLQAMIDAGWVMMGSWPIDTEMGTRLRARDSAALASSVHLVCRPRENPDGSVRADDVGDWRDVLAELPRRIHDWMPRLAAEGVVGADAIFACLGPALEIFSRYSRVERANGDLVTLREYLEQVWAAVSREALSMIFADPETAGLDPDARLTAMWLWTIAAPAGTASDIGPDDGADDESDEDEEDSRSKTARGATGFTLEFDAARKIAQGLGAKLEDLTHVVEVKGDKARLLGVAERTKHLFGGGDAAPTARRPPKKKQRALFEELEEAAAQQGWGEVGVPTAGSTTLDRVHQAMILFAAGRGEALKRFIVEEGAGRQPQFWKLAQALSALYPPGTDEKRWVDGVLARKKSLGY